MKRTNETNANLTLFENSNGQRQPPAMGKGSGPCKTKGRGFYANLCPTLQTSNSFVAVKKQSSNKGLQNMAKVKKSKANTNTSATEEALATTPEAPASKPSKRKSKEAPAVPNKPAKGTSKPAKGKGKGGLGVNTVPAVTVVHGAPNANGRYGGSKVFGKSLTSFVRWLGWEYQEKCNKAFVLRVLSKLGLHWEGTGASPTMVGLQLTSGRRGEEGPHGPVPVFTGAEEKVLKALCKEVFAELASA